MDSYIVRLCIAPSWFDSNPPLFITTISLVMGVGRHPEVRRSDRAWLPDREPPWPKLLVAY